MRVDRFIFNLQSERDIDQNVWYISCEILLARRLKKKKMKQYLVFKISEPALRAELSKKQKVWRQFASANIIHVVKICP